MVLSRRMETKTNELTRAVLACLFAALISIGAYIALPLPGTPVPIVLQNFFIIVAATVLGPLWGLVSICIYLLFGLVGIPVFSGGTGGISKLLGPTGGYLFGYLFAVPLMGFASRLGKGRHVAVGAAGLLGTFVIYLCGLAWLKLSLGLGWEKALGVGVLPFLPADLAKVALAAFVVPKLKQGIAALDPSVDA